MIVLFLRYARKICGTLNLTIPPFFETWVAKGLSGVLVIWDGQDNGDFVSSLVILISCGLGNVEGNVGGCEDGIVGKACRSFIESSIAMV